MSLPCVYILASQPYGTLYIGVTSDLIQRIWQHKNGESDGFTKKYRVLHLVYFEQFEATSDAILREKQLKKWNRQWKIQLIESANPHWLDLYKNLRTTIR
ncbi:GIY-YIG nuclease family protein [Vibrio vulnificus]|uniref:GIY-YIG nuclease family protein n=1 Tax=Vibrio vulnificus TaxID=672 RepID=UPI003D9C7F76